MSRISAGQRVRVSDGTTSSRRALILCPHAEGFDVEFEGTDEEESNVPLSRIAALLDFELGAARVASESGTDDESPPARAEKRKQQGNQLFKLHDHAAAAEEYAAGLRALRLEVTVHMHDAAHAVVLCGPLCNALCCAPVGGTG